MYISRAARPRAIRLRAIRLQVIRCSDLPGLQGALRHAPLSVLAVCVILTTATTLAGTAWCAPAPPVDKATQADKANQPELVLATGHGGGISSIAYAPNGQSFVTSSLDKTVKQWDASTGTLLRILASDLWLYSLAFSPDGRQIAAAQGYSAIVRFWDAAMGRVTANVSLPSLPPQLSQSATSLSFSPDGKTLAIGTGAQIVTYDPATLPLRGRIVLLDAHTHSVLWNADAHDERTQVVKFSPDGKTIASSGADHALKIWDAKSGTLKATWTPAPATPPPPFPASPEISAMAFSPDGKLLATSGSSSNQTTIWDVSAAKPLHVLPVNAPRLAFLPDNTTLVAGQTGYVINLWNATSGTQLRQVGQQPDGPDAMALSPDGKTLLTGGGNFDRSLNIWDVATAELRDRVAGLTAWPGRLVFSSDASLLAVGSEDGTARVWNLRQGRLRRTIGPPGGLAERVSSLLLAPDNRTLALARSHQTDVAVWDVETGELRYTLTELLSQFIELALSPDGKLLATSSGKVKEGEVKFWDTATGKLVSRLPALPMTAISLAFSPDNASLATLEGDSDKAQIKVWDMASLKLLRTLSGSHLRRGKIVFSPDGKSIAVGGYSEGVTLIDTQSGALQQRIREPMAGYAFCFAPDGQSLLVGQREGAIKVCDVTTGKVTGQWAAHTSGVSYLAYSPGGDRIATASADGTVKLWRSTDKQLLVTFAILSTRWQDEKASTEWIIFTPQGQYEASAGADKFIRWRVGDKLLPASAYKASFNKPEQVQAALGTGP
jgi:WD40 repeat protein